MFKSKLPAGVVAPALRNSELRGNFQQSQAEGKCPSPRQDPGTGSWDQTFPSLPAQDSSTLLRRQIWNQNNCSEQQKTPQSLLLQLQALCPVPFLRETPTGQKTLKHSELCSSEPSLSLRSCSHLTPALRTSLGRSCWNV